MSVPPPPEYLELPPQLPPLPWDLPTPTVPQRWPTHVLNSPTIQTMYKYAKDNNLSEHSIIELRYARQLYRARERRKKKKCNAQTTPTETSKGWDWPTELLSAENPQLINEYAEEQALTSSQVTLLKGARKNYRARVRAAKRNKWLADLKENYETALRLLDAYKVPHMLPELNE